MRFKFSPFFLFPSLLNLPLRKIIICLLFVLIQNLAFSQVENVPAGHPVYSFLKQMQVEGKIKNYSDVILPLSKAKVIDYLSSLDSVRTTLTIAEQEFLLRMKEKFDLNTDATGLFDDFPSSFIENLVSDKQKNIYRYKDSLVSFYINPVVKYSLIYSGVEKTGATLLELGGKAYGSYDNWLGFYMEGSNGSQFGSRNTALIEPAVKQSYTFNKTKLNYFDGTNGYIRLQKGIASVQLGRERVTWGTGYINKLFLSENPPLFDFVKFDISYKSLSYNFIHGWLTQKPVLTHIDSLYLDVKDRKSKYFAISRLQFTPTDYLSFGASQVIVYSNRPFEAAYLNPFIFWESAQRSMNDLDNSMLSFDGRYLITGGLELSSSVIFDDLNFKRIAQHRWVDNTNGLAWQAGSFITSPVLPDNFSLKIEYTQLRPYMYSHPGVGEALTYTNNGYMLGTDIQPNSTLFSVEAGYRCSGKLDFKITYSHYLHGNNLYDENGNLVQNFGGNVINFLSWRDAQDAYLLNGVRERRDELSFNLNYEITFGIYFNLLYTYRDENIAGSKGNNNIFIGRIIMDFE